jgi:GT2 family glycosyltransferase
VWIKLIMNSMKIAAVIVTYNRKDELKKTVEYLTSQGLPIEIIVIDNNSKDATQEVVKTLSLNANIHYLLQSENLGSAGGFAAGMAYGLKNGFDYVWLFNDDSRPHPSALSTLLTAIKNLSDANLGLIKIGMLRNGKSEASYWKGRRITHYIPKSDTPVKTDLITFDGCFIHTKVIDNIGTCDPNFFMGIYEFDFCLRALDAGFTIYTLPNGLIEDEKKGSASGVPFWRMYYVTRNHLYLGIKRKSAQTIFAFTLLEVKKFLSIMFLQKDKLIKLQYKSKAILDALTGKMGRTVEPK